MFFSTSVKLRLATVKGYELYATIEKETKQNIGESNSDIPEVMTLEASSVVSDS